MYKLIVIEGFIYYFLNDLFNKERKQLSFKQEK